jgi:hypothetical protein
MGDPNLVEPFSEIRDEFPSPEHINNNPLSAPSKRVAGLCPGYDKPVAGSVAALSIGLAAAPRMGDADSGFAARCRAYRTARLLVSAHRTETCLTLLLGERRPSEPGQSDLAGLLWR